MRLRPHPFVMSVMILLAAAAVPVAAQTSPDAGALHGGLYRLSTETSFEEGCFAPCLCPIRIASGVLGTFRMTEAAPDPLFQIFDVTEVNWIVPGTEDRVTGSGTYRIGGEFARMHQLRLDLKIGDREVQHFDSGLLQGGAEFPAIVISIAVNGMICFDTVFNLKAKPVLPIEIVPFSLDRSDYEEGCFGPCDCLVTSWPLVGRFGLLRLDDTTEQVDFAVLDIDWRAREPVLPPATDARVVTGYGLYRLLKSAGQKRMVLDLIENGGGPTRFDSGTVPGGGSTKRIDIDLAESAFACFDRVYSIHARRRPSVAYLQGLGTEPVTATIAPAP